MLLVLLTSSTGSCVNTSSKAKQTPPKSVKVMIVDTGISTRNPKIKKFLSKDNDRLDLQDDHGHGTHITGLILYGPKLDSEVCKEVVVYSCKFHGENAKETSECFDRARKLKVQIVNLSGGGAEYIPQEYTSLLKLALSAKIVVASGNDKNDISKKGYYPASLNVPGMEVVGNGYSENFRVKSSNYGLKNMIWRNGFNIASFDTNQGLINMTGSSQAAAIRTHELVKAACQRLRSSK